MEMLTDFLEATDSILIIIKLKKKHYSNKLQRKQWKHSMSLVKAAHTDTEVFAVSNVLIV